jgi:serine/threonine-protein kinase
VAASSFLPSAIGPFRVLSELGRGMMGVVYKAEDTRSGRAVALKVIRLAMAVSDEQQKTFERRFVEEAQIVARLDHPGIVAVYEIGRDKKEKAPFIAFEYLEGRTLSAILENGAVPWEDALPVIVQLARALHHAHEQGVIHRDIKPANIMVVEKGAAKGEGKDKRLHAASMVKIMDFGLAKRDAGAELTSTGQFLGTPLYMSPEQALGRKVDARTDVFSLGCVAYTLITGKRAFEADSIPQVMNKVTYQHPPKPSQVVRSVPGDVDYLLARAMAKSPDDRYATAQAFAEDVEDVLKRKPPRHRAGWTSLALAEGTVVAGRGPTRTADDTAPDLEPTAELDLEAASGRRPRRGNAGPVAVLGLSMLALGAVLYSSTFLRGHLARLVDPQLPPPTLGFPADASAGDATTGATARVTPTATPVSAAAAVTEAPTDASAPSPMATTEPTPSPTATSALTATEPPLATSAAPATGARPTPTPRPRPRPHPTEQGRLSVTFEHSLKSGTLRISIDGELVHEEKLTSRVTKDMLLFKERSGKAQEVLTVAPGKRHLRVEVRSEGDVHSREIVATFVPGKTRRLEVKLKGDSVALSWR